MHTMSDVYCIPQHKFEAVVLALVDGEFCAPDDVWRAYRVVTDCYPSWRATPDYAADERRILAEVKARRAKLSRMGRTRRQEQERRRAAEFAQYVTLPGIGDAAEEPSPVEAVAHVAPVAPAPVAREVHTP